MSVALPLYCIIVGSLFDVFRKHSYTEGHNTIQILAEETKAIEDNITSMTLLEHAIEEKRIVAVIVVSVLVAVLAVVSLVIWIAVLVL